MLLYERNVAGNFNSVQDKIPVFQSILAKPYIMQLREYTALVVAQQSAAAIEEDSAKSVPHLLTSIGLRINRRTDSISRTASA